MSETVAPPRPKANRFGAGVAGFVLNPTNHITAEERLALSEARFRVITEAVPQMIWTARPDGYHDFFNARWYEFTGVADGSTEGEGWRGLFHPDDQAAIDVRWARSLATGEPYEIEYRLRHVGGEWRWVLGRALPVRDGEGRVTQWLGTCTDIHTIKQTQAHRQLLLDELDHRVKNTLAIVLSIAYQTLRKDGAARDAYTAFEGRLRALASAHDVLTGASWQEAPVATLVEGARRACSVEPGRWDATGPALILQPKQAVALAMAIHELCTNAVKYGALSVDGGSVTISWEANGAGLRLTWTERGGPPVSKPSRTGFGTRLLERALTAELGGSVVLDYRIKGLICTLDCTPASAPEAWSGGAGAVAIPYSSSVA